MTQCKKCGSHAVNPKSHGREDDVDLDLCDVCYWRKRAEEKLTKTQAWGRSELMALAAVRYCLGRMTYIVGDCADWLCAAWDELPEGVRAIIKRDVEEAFTRDDEDRASGRDYKALGHDCDRESWERVRKLWKDDGK